MADNPGRRVEVQGSLFEEDYLRRTLGDVVRIPDVALSELVANAWDAGATKVDITIPGHHGELLSVEDDGCGLDEGSFRQRWMTLGYDRQKHQGAYAEFPAERSDWSKRRAYGRNGQGRHGLLCFGDHYEVETWRDGTAYVFEVRTTTGKDPFIEKLLRQASKAGHGTKVSVAATTHLPDPDRIRDLLSGCFLHDPRFNIAVNGVAVALDAHPNRLAEQNLVVRDGVRLNLLCVEGEPRRTKHQSGIAFWVGQRLVGEPGWVIDRIQVLDGRTKPGRRLTFVIRTDDLYDEVLPDWTGFKHTELMKDVYAVVTKAVQCVLHDVLLERVAETRGDVMDVNRKEIQGLSRLDRIEVADLVEVVTDRYPLMDVPTITTAVRGVIEAKQRRSREALMQRLLLLPPEDIDGLHRLLDEWTVRDALTVLDEIGRRIKLVETLEKVASDRSVDELRVLHPLVTQARWLFGPEYESATFASNVSVRNAVEKVFGEHKPPDAFENARVRPDLLFRPDSTLSAVCTEDVEPDSGISKLRTVLLIELKKGGAEIGRTELDQAAGYTEDLLNCGLLDGPPRVYAFVVGHSLSPKLNPVRKVGEPEVGRIEAVTFNRLVRTANARLFNLRDRVEERCHGTGHALLDAIQTQPEQTGLRLPPKAEVPEPVTKTGAEDEAQDPNGSER